MSLKRCKKRNAGKWNTIRSLRTALHCTALHCTALLTIIAAAETRSDLAISLAFISPCQEASAVSQKCELSRRAFERRLDDQSECRHVLYLNPCGVTTGAMTSLVAYRGLYRAIEYPRASRNFTLRSTPRASRIKFDSDREVSTLHHLRSFLSL